MVSPKGSGPQEAAALFDAERSARLRGDYARVIELHRELVARHPQSHEALVSRATVGQLLLDRGDPAAALASFDGYLDASAGRGELAEVALVGKATALDRLGRTEEARSAWRALLVAFPDTPYAKHAASRLAVTTAGGAPDPSLR
jgi:tetratricopeptide (TPR) repeat protein